MGFDAADYRGKPVIGIINTWSDQSVPHTLPGARGGGDRQACERILDAEVVAGRRMVMVGFMRRYDEAYRTGGPVTVTMREKPDLYQEDGPAGDLTATGTD